MAADQSHPDPKTLWKELEPETDPVTLEHIHDLAGSFDRKARRVLVLMPIAWVFFAFLFGQQWQSVHDPLRRAGIALTLAGVLVSGYLGMRVVFPPRDPAEPAGAYLRRRLQRSLANVRGGWTIMLVPMLPSVVLNFYLAYGRSNPSPPWVKFLPLALLVAVIAFVLRRTTTGAPRIREQIRELDELLNR